MAVASGVICAWPSTNASIPSGWSRVTALDDRYVKMVATAATNPGATGGAATHDHPQASHSHGAGSHAHSSCTGNASSSAGTTCAGAGTVYNRFHPITNATVCPGTSGAGSGTWGTATSDPPFFRVIFIKSDGSPSGLPNAAVAWWNTATPPTSWRACDGAGGAPDLRDRFMRGAATSGDGGGTGGTSDSHSHSSATGHTHTGVSHTHSISSVDAPASTTRLIACPSATFGDSHTHGVSTLALSSDASGALNSASPSSTTGDALPLWTKSFAIQNNAGAASLPKDIICIWDGTIASIPAGWKIADGASGTPNLSNDRFVRALNTTGQLGTTGGATTHSHTGSHTHTTAGHAHTLSGDVASTTPASVGSRHNSAGCGAVFYHDASAHTHNNGAGSVGSASPASGSGCAAASANTTNDPLFTGVAYIQYQGNPSNPTITVPLAAQTYSGVVTLTCSSTDPDGETWFSTWEYRRGAGAYTVIGNGSTVASGANSTLSWDTDPLANATDYEVRVKATDTGTPARESGYTSSGTFTINYLPTVTSLNTPVSGAAYSTTMTLDATLADADLDTVTAEFEYSANSGGSWTTIGDGTAVASGSRSTRVWDIATLAPAITYRVRVRARDALGGLSAYTSTTDFTIGPSLSRIFAESNTAFYFAESNTAAYFAEPN